MGGNTDGGKGALLGVLEGTVPGMASMYNSAGKGVGKATVTTGVFRDGMWMIGLRTLPPDFPMVATTTMTMKRVERAVTTSGVSLWSSSVKRGVGGGTVVPRRVT